MKHTNFLMNVAKLAAQESHCKKRQVGAVIAKEGRIFASGWNGTIEGSENDCEDESGKNKNTTLHAEANAIMQMARYGIKTVDCVIFSTTAPCIECSKLIAQSGIRAVYYVDNYKNHEGLEYLKMVGMEVIQLD